MIPAFLAILSSALFGGNAVAVRLALGGAAPIVITVVSVVTNLVMLWGLAALTSDLALATTTAAWIFIGAGVLAPALARLAYYTAIGLVGIAPASVASNTTPIFAALGAVVFLGERLTPGVALGTLGVVLGVALTSYGPGGGEKPGAGRLGIPLALATAILAAVSFVLRKIGLGLIPQPALAAALTQTGALAGLLPLIAVRARRERIHVSSGAWGPLLATGLLSTGAFLSYFLALNLGALSRVTPLGNISPLFALLLLRFAFRTVEPVPARTFAGAALMVAGVILVVSA